jgi:hypothetical protein
MMNTEQPPPHARLTTATMPDLSRGLALGRIIRDLRIGLGHFKDNDTPIDRMRAELGCAFEDYLIHTLQHNEPGRYEQSELLIVDGIRGIPDLIDTQDRAVEEVKFTWMSARHEPDSEKLWAYWVQVKAYGYMLGLETVRLRVGFVNGTYEKPNMYPVYRVWEQRLSEAELAANWRMLTTHAQVMRDRRLTEGTVAV